MAPSAQAFPAADDAAAAVLDLERWLAGWRPDGGWARRTSYRAFGAEIGCSHEHARRLALGITRPDDGEATRIAVATDGAVTPESFTRPAGPPL
jgi:hypothetical protein